MIIFNKICIILIVFCLNVNNTYGSSLEDPIPQKIGTYLKSFLNEVQDEDVQTLMSKHFTKIHLRSEENEWVHPSLEDIHLKHSRQSLENLVDQISQNVQGNPYLMDVLNTVSSKDSRLFYQKIEKDDHKKKISNLLSYAMSLEVLNVAMRKNLSLLKETVRIWDEKIGNHPFKIYKKAGLLFLIKYYSVRAPIVKGIKSLESGRIDGNFSRNMLPLNILEASFVDYINGYQGNANAGWILAQNPPGGPENTLTGSGPASFSEDGSSLKICCPFPKQWADLYTVWNLGFLSSTSNPLYWYTKLLIPSVSGYQKSPEEYIHNRTLALYTSLNYAFQMYDDQDRDLLSIDFSIPEITAIFDEINDKNARIYADQVKRTKTH